jgi:predicted RNase H-like HicB family nuclease
VHQARRFAVNKTAEYYASLPYTIELRNTPDEGWFARVRELPGCMSQGETADDAVANIQEAMHLWLEVSLEQGDAIPEPRSEEAYSGKFVVRVPRSLHRDLAETAEREGVSLNQYINTALAQSVGAMRAGQAQPGQEIAARYVARIENLVGELAAVLRASGQTADATPPKRVDRYASVLHEGTTPYTITRGDETG